MLRSEEELPEVSHVSLTHRGGPVSGSDHGLLIRGPTESPWMSGAISCGAQLPGPTLSVPRLSMNGMTEPREVPYEPRGRDPGLTGRAVQWEEFKQRCRAHRPIDLVRALAAIGARDFDGRPVQPKTSGSNPWAVAAVIRESLAYGNDYRNAPVTPAALNRLLAAHNDLDDPFMRSADASPWDLILRTVYHQFSWHASIFNDLARFGAALDRDFPPGTYERLSRSALDDLLGAPLHDFHAATFLFTVAAQCNQGLFDLTWFDKPHFEAVTDVVAAETIRRIFRQSFTAPLADITARARAGRNPDPELRVHDFNPLFATPYIGMNADIHYAPLPRLVADKASLASVYYQGLAKWGEPFSRDLGKLVEVYAGEQLSLIPEAVLSGERDYEHGSLSVDWIVVLPTVVLLVEVKSARVAQPSRLTLPAFLKDVTIDVGKSLGQIARTADLVRAAHRAFDDIPKDRPLRGVVITAEPHHLINSPIYRKGLEDPTVPTIVLSLDELEHAVAFTLVADPSHVLTELTDWHETSPVNVTDSFIKWNRERGARAVPRNPILDAAWNRLPWKEAEGRRRGRR